MSNCVRPDRFYPWLLFYVMISAGGLTWWQAASMLGANAAKMARFESGKEYLIFGLLVWTVGILLWRIWFACRYRSYAPAVDKELPTVTVIIPAYNEGAQVLSTVRSVMASWYPHQKMQVICVDDGSQDDTWYWMQRAQREFPRRIQLIRQPANRGKRQALMAGFAQATGQVYVTIDSDSEVMENSLRHLVSPFVHDKRIGGVAGNVRVLNLDEGTIPKMMEVSFTTAFDFIRSGQSVYGGVFCTPGAFSAYRASVIASHLSGWAKQVFMGRAATIGEDRALTNLILSAGYRVTYQREAVVRTKMPRNFHGLRRMLLRWARSNVRENLVMLGFLLRRFRRDDAGSGWIRLFSATQFIRMTLGEALKFALLAQLILSPRVTLCLMMVGCLSSALLPAIVYQIRYGGWFGWRWAIPYSLFWLTCLAWIPIWGLATAPRSGWLTRDLGTVPDAPVLIQGISTVKAQEVSS